MWKTEQKVREYVEKYHMISQGDRVVAGISGGADSVCLLLLLKEIQKYIDFDIIAVHVNHSLRGKEADEDQEFVRRLCEREQTEFAAVKEDVKSIALKEGISLEEAGRNVRYQSFDQIAEEKGGNKIALAHHQDDQAETMIHHLARGTGLKGLCALKPVAGNRLRPLLCLTRKEVEEYLIERGQSWQTDKTNLEDDYTRNKIRHHVIEYLSENINPKAAVHMAETAEELGEVEELLVSLEKEKQKEHVVRKNAYTILKESLSREASVLQRRIILEEIKHAGGKSKDFTRTHGESVEQLWKKQVGKQVMLPYGIVAERTYEGIRIQASQNRKEGKNIRMTQDPSYQIRIPEEIRIGEYTVSFTLVSSEFHGIVEKKYTKWFDYDKILSNLELRCRKTGDRICINRSGGSKKLKDFMIDIKIPKEERDTLPLLADGSDILWVVGHRISEKYKITESTEKIIQVQIKGGNIHE